MIMRFLPHGSPLQGTPNVVEKFGRVLYSAESQTRERRIYSSETVQTSTNVTIEHEYELVICDLSNGVISNDFE